MTSLPDTDGEGHQLLLSGEDKHEPPEPVGHLLHQKEFGEPKEASPERDTGHRQGR